MIPKKEITFDYFSETAVTFQINKHTIIINEVDMPLVISRCWMINHNGYCVSQSRKNLKPERLHRKIMNPTNQQQVDHIDGNRLNNQRNNLRICASRQNQMNMRTEKQKVGSKGVYFKKPKGQKPFFVASICVNKKYIHLGVFTSEYDASKAYNDASIKYFGQFARKNGEL